jgi:hypothetical protein
MKQVIIAALLGLAGSAAVSQPATTRSTAKSADPFVQCFAAAQDHDARAWAFVPRESGGGTFSNAGASGVRKPYFVQVADRGTSREIRLSGGADASVRRAVDLCI